MPKQFIFKFVQKKQPFNLLMRPTCLYIFLKISIHLHVCFPTVSFILQGPQIQHPNFKTIKHDVIIHLIIHQNT